MSVTITADLLEAYLTCQTKAYLKLVSHRAQLSDYLALKEQTRSDLRLRAIDNILSEQRPDDVVTGLMLTRAELRRGPTFVLDSEVNDEGVDFHVDGLKREKGSSKLGSFHYVPILFHEDGRVHKTQKQILAAFGVLLSRVQGKMPEIGMICHGSQCVGSKIQLGELGSDAEQLLESLAELHRSNAEPTLVLNDHCPVCEFRDRCRQKAINEDNLSLLRGMDEKEMKRYARKGIFTIGQLSHTFRPRRKGIRFLHSIRWARVSPTEVFGPPHPRHER
jgi:predicted RecB family nuclease